MNREFTRTQRANYAISQLYKLMKLGVISKAVYQQAKKATEPEKIKIHSKYASRSSLKGAELKKMRKQIKDLQETVDRDLATHTYRKI